MGEAGRPSLRVGTDGDLPRTTASSAWMEHSSTRVGWSRLFGVPCPSLAHESACGRGLVPAEFREDRVNVILVSRCQTFPD